MKKCILILIIGFLVGIFLKFVFLNLIEIEKYEREEHPYLVYDKDRTIVSSYKSSKEEFILCLQGENGNKYYIYTTYTNWRQIKIGKWYNFTNRQINNRVR